MIRPKLVRDRIPEIIRESGVEPVVRRVSSDQAYWTLLIAKLHEEADELARAAAIPQNSRAVLFELADLFEVLATLTQESGFDTTLVERAAMEKAQARGYFGKRWMWFGNEDANRP